MDPKELLRHWRQFRHQMDPQGEQEQENLEHRRRRLDVRERWDGSGDVEGRLDAEGTAVLKTVLHGLLGPRRPATSVPPASGGPTRSSSWRAGGWTRATFRSEESNGRTS
jgi:hypothetical protein